MKAKIIAVILAATISTEAVRHLVSWQFKNRYYAQCCVVTNVCHKASHDVVTVQNCNGFLYEFCSDEEDWDVGDAASVIMDTNGTDLVTDDVVVAAKYDRLDLLG